MGHSAETLHDITSHHITSHCTTDTRAWATRRATTSSATSPSSALRSSARRARPRLRREEEEASRAVDRGGPRPLTSSSAGGGGRRGHGGRRTSSLRPLVVEASPPETTGGPAAAAPTPREARRTAALRPGTEHGDVPRKRRTAATRVGERGTCRDSFATRLLVGARTRPSSSTSPRRPKASSVRSFVRSGLRGSFGLSLLPWPGLAARARNPDLSKPSGRGCGRGGGNGR